jgi:hypothetical protein
MGKEARSVAAELRADEKIALRDLLQVQRDVELLLGRSREVPRTHEIRPLIQSLTSILESLARAEAFGSALREIGFSRDGDPV